MTQLFANELLPGLATYRTVVGSIVLCVVGRRHHRPADRCQTFNATRRATLRSSILQRRSVLERARVLQRATALQRAGTLEGTGALKRTRRLNRTGALQRAGILQRTTTLLRSVLRLLGVCRETTVDSHSTRACPLHRANPLHRTRARLTGTCSRLGRALRRLCYFGTNLRSRAHGPKKAQDGSETLCSKRNFCHENQT